MFESTFHRCPGGDLAAVLLISLDLSECEPERAGGIGVDLRTIERDNAAVQPGLFLRLGVDDGEDRIAGLDRGLAGQLGIYRGIDSVRDVLNRIEHTYFEARQLDFLIPRSGNEAVRDVILTRAGGVLNAPRRDVLVGQNESIRRDERSRSSADPHRRRAKVVGPGLLQLKAEMASEPLIGQLVVNPHPCRRVQQVLAQARRGLEALRPDLHHRFRVIDGPTNDARTLVLEVALTEVVPSKVLLNALGFAPFYVGTGISVVRTIAKPGEKVPPTPTFRLLPW
jgi:hypothetical protein